MEIIQTSDPRVIKIKPVTGCSRLTGMVFGAPFLLVGILIILLPVFKPGEFSGGHASAITVGGALFAMAGAVMAFRRYGVTIDMHERAVIRWWGVVFPLRKSRFMVDEYTDVKVGPGVKQGEKITGDSSYPVVLKGPADKEAKLVYVKGHKEAKAMASRVAEFTGLNT